MDAPRGDNYGEPIGERYTVWLNRLETTVGEYMEFCKETGNDMPAQPAESTHEYPIVNVTWSEAAAYCAWRGGRLPRYREWRQGIGLYEQSIGAHWVSKRGLIVEEGNCPDPEHLYGPVRTVGSNIADVTPEGAHDLWGNACEWLYDDPGREGPSTPVSDSGVPVAFVAPRVETAFARRAYYFVKTIEPTRRSPVIGFRVCFDSSVPR